MPSSRGSSDPGIEPESLESPTLAGGFSTSSDPGKPEVKLRVTCRVRRARALDKLYSAMGLMVDTAFFGVFFLFSIMNPRKHLFHPILFKIKLRCDIFHEIPFVQLIKHETVPGLTIKPRHSTHLL